jgi:hypothetical protein
VTSYLAMLQQKLFSCWLQEKQQAELVELCCEAYLAMLQQKLNHSITPIKCAPTHFQCVLLLLPAGEAAD